jgi:hypothetical protein
MHGGGGSKRSFAQQSVYESSPQDTGNIKNMEYATIDYYL